MNMKKVTDRKVVSFRPSPDSERIISLIAKTLGWSVQEVMSKMVEEYGKQFLESKFDEVQKNFQEAKEILGKSPAAVAA